MSNASCSAHNHFWEGVRTEGAAVLVAAVGLVGEPYPLIALTLMSGRLDCALLARRDRLSGLVHDSVSTCKPWAS